MADPSEFTSIDRLIVKGGSYPVWSPDRAFEAAATLLRILDAEDDRTNACQSLPVGGSWVMSHLMEQAIEQLRQLPTEDQEAMASIILREIESDRRWDELFTRPGSDDLLSRLADEAIAEARAGRARPLDIDEL